MKKIRYTVLVAAVVILCAGCSKQPDTTSLSPAASQAAAVRWIDTEFKQSTLNREQQLAELQWFAERAAELRARGVQEISVVSETLTVHEYESKTLAKAFTEITGIKVNHELMQEGDLVEKLQTSMQAGRSIYDGWVSDSDLIGTHYRYGKIMNLTDYMAGAGKPWTNPGLALGDFIGTSFTTAPDGKLYQLPDQQFANLYWFRADLFARPDLREKFRKKYGYELGVPLNWSAYEDIAAFFTEDVKEIDGRKHEPFEILVVDVPADYSGKVIDLVTQKKGEMLIMESKGTMQHLEFDIPSRGLIGLRSQMLTQTAGEAVMAHRFNEYKPWKGPIPGRSNGVLVAKTAGLTTAYSIDKLQDRGRFFIEPGEEIYAGQVLAEHIKPGDLNINAVEMKKLTNHRASGSDDSVRITPKVLFTLEECMEYIQFDECIEVTPKSVRMRKSILDENNRSKATKAGQN